MIKQSQYRDNDTWLLDLSASGIQRDRALVELRAILLSGLRAALRGWVHASGREFGELCEDFVQEALVQILDKLETFKGLSRFTTWAHKICIRIALSELRRKRWQDSSLDEHMEQGDTMPDTKTPEPDAGMQSSMSMTWLMTAMQEELSEKQMAALTLVALKGVPLEVAAERLGTNRNALYKLIHDARLRLKARMARDGMTMGDLGHG
jgi:RNA polymerase sigma-70 factor (ECF subfamily)